jgi:hypothetical protein
LVLPPPPQQQLQLLQQYWSTTYPLMSETPKSTKHSGHLTINLCTKTMCPLEIIPRNELM